jgi:hypothetical protein
VFLEAIFNRDGPAEKLEELKKEKKPDFYLFEEPLSFTRALLTAFGEAKGDRGPACLKLCRFARQAVGDDEARRRNFFLVTVACSHDIGVAMYNKLLREVFTMDELYANLDSISGGEFSRRKQEAIRVALAPVIERAETAESKLKEVEARAEAEVKNLKDKVARLEGIIDDAGLSKGPGGR